MELLLQRPADGRVDRLAYVRASERVAGEIEHAVWISRALEQVVQASVRALENSAARMLALARILHEARDARLAGVQVAPIPGRGPWQSDGSDNSCGNVGLARKGNPRIGPLVIVDEQGDAQKLRIEI